MAGPKALLLQQKVKSKLFQNAYLVSLSLGCTLAAPQKSRPILIWVLPGISAFLGFKLAAPLTRLGPTLKVLFKVELRPDGVVPAPAVEFVCAFPCFTRSQAHPGGTGTFGPFFNLCQQGFANTLLFVLA